MTNSDLQEKLTSWFNRTGFPLEIETARAYFAQKFGVEHSAVYPDPETKSSREIDVLAYLGDGTGTFSTLFPVECKSGDKPWVVLTNPEQYSQYGGLWIAAMSSKAREAMADNIFEYVELYEKAFGRSTGGFSLKQAFSGETDNAYSACMSALKSANSLISEESHPRIVFAFPTLVVNTPSFEYSEGHGGQQHFTEVLTSSFSFSAHMNGYSRAIIRIVSRDALAMHAENCRFLAEQYRALFASQTKALALRGT
jgi:hypothetical protein